MLPSTFTRKTVWQPPGPSAMSVASSGASGPLREFKSVMEPAWDGDSLGSPSNSLGSPMLNQNSLAEHSIRSVTWGMDSVHKGEGELRAGVWSAGRSPHLAALDEMGSPLGPPPPGLPLPFADARDDDDDSLGNSTFSRNPWEDAKQKARAWDVQFGRPPEPSPRRLSRAEELQRAADSAGKHVWDAPVYEAPADPVIGAPRMAAAWLSHPQLRLVKDMPLARAATPALPFRAPPRRDAGAFSRDLLLRSRSGRVQPRYNQSTSAQMNLHGAGCNVDRRPGISWDLACEDHQGQGALGGPNAFGVVVDGVYPQRPAGSGHINMGVHGQQFGGPPRVTPHYRVQTRGFSEEERRLFLLTNERKRRGSDIRQRLTHTIPGLGE